MGYGSRRWRVTERRRRALAGRLLLGVVLMGIPGIGRAATTGELLRGARTGQAAASRPGRKKAARKPRRPVRVPGALGRLEIRPGAKFGPRTAGKVLAAAGYYHPRVLDYHRSRGARNRFQAALMALKWGDSFYPPSGPVAWGPEMRRMVYREYRLLRTALRRYRKHPTVSQESKPKLFDLWVQRASRHLRSVPSGQRASLLRSLMKQESGRVQWERWRPVVSFAGAVGIGQFLPAISKSLRFNHHDPAQNIAGIARFLQQLISRKGSVREALASYNGGENPPSSSYAYADAILGRV